MRKHRVECEIVGNQDGGRQNVQITMNEFYVKNIEKILGQSVMTKAEKLALIDEIINKVKK